MSGTGAYYDKTVKGRRWRRCTRTASSVADGEIGLETVKGKLAAAAGSGAKLSVAAATGLFTGISRATTANGTRSGARCPGAGQRRGVWLWPDASAAGYRLNRSFPVKIVDDGARETGPAKNEKGGA